MICCKHSCLLLIIFNIMKQILNIYFSVFVIFHCFTDKWRKMKRDGGTLRQWYNAIDTCLPNRSNAMLSFLSDNQITRKRFLPINISWDQEAKFSFKCSTDQLDRTPVNLYPYQISVLQHSRYY